MRARSLLLTVWGGTVALLAGTGCAGFFSAPRRPPPPPAAPVPRGLVIHVNAEERYAILECVVPPPAGWEFPLIRGGVTSAVVRATDRRRGILMAADIKHGTPRAGDEFGVEENKSEARP